MFLPIYTIFLAIMMSLITSIHFFYMDNIKHTIFSSETIYSSILSGSGSELVTTNCGTGMVYTINKIKENKINEVKVFIPKVDTLNSITNYDLWGSGRNLTNCNNELNSNGISFQEFQTGGIYLKSGNTSIFLGKNTVKDDLSISY